MQRGTTKTLDIEILVPLQEQREDLYPETK